MEKISITEDFLKYLDECSQGFSEMNAQTQMLYKAVKDIKDLKEQEQLIRAYKQVYDAFGKSVNSFGSLVKEIRKQVEDNGK